MVEKIYVRRGRGRPIAVVKLRKNASPHVHGLFTLAAFTIKSLHYIEKVLGRDHVSKIAASIYSECLDYYRIRLDSLDSESKIKELISMRNSEGYDTIYRKIRRATYEIVENRCPLIAVSQTYSEICRAEARFIQDALKARVSLIHSIAEGQPQCRFLVVFKDQK